jgi:hypothetical protein
MSTTTNSGKYLFSGSGNTGHTIFTITDDADYFEQSTKLDKDGDPLVCVMLSGLGANVIFEDSNQYTTQRHELLPATYTTSEISAKLARGDKLTAKGQAIFDHANEIRDYYTARLVEEKLTNKERRDSQFATDLMSALRIRGTIKPEYAGIYHKLQDFYLADTKWDNLVSTQKPVSGNQEFASGNSLKPARVDLKYVDHMYSSSNKSNLNKVNYCRYYFTDRNDYLYEFSVPASNTLRTFLEHYFQTFNESNTPWMNVTIFARREQCPVPFYKNEFNYFKIIDWAGLTNNTQGE